MTIDESHPKEPNAIAAWILAFLFFVRYTYGLSDTLSELLLKFLKVVFNVLSGVSEVCAAIARSLPGTLYAMRKKYLHNESKILQYVVCQKCCSVYKQEDCTDGSALNPNSKLCPHKEFPRHPHIYMRQSCGELLLKTIELSSGKRILYPYMSYCYLSLKYSIESLLSNPITLQSCGKWALRNNTNKLQNVYDGAIWKNFLHCKGKPFLANPYTLGLTMNIDWFQPFKHTTYSLGAIYITIMNLPRDVRYKRENVILCGLIPGPKEPHNVSPFLQPLVSELIELWKGVTMTLNGNKRKVKAALLCVACDVPAGRKVCGFVGHTAHYGCSRCSRYFPGSFGAIDFSGFDRDTWTYRSAINHRKAISKLNKAKTKSKIEEIESEGGYRYTELLKLPYFVPCRMLIVDPMHNLFIGTAKRIMKSLWINNGMVTSEHLQLIQSRITNSICPPEIGRIPLKIETGSGFSQLTADQLKNWVVYFSVISLRDIITGDDMECWRHFVLACRILCQKQLTNSEVCVADALLLQFCRRVERMYGKDFITPNIHLHAHLKECILDYGPLHSFWLFSFERYNGILGKIATNNRSVEC